MKQKIDWFEWLVPIAIGALLALLSLPVRGVTLEWDANSESNLAGYRVYRGTESHVYTQVADVVSTQVILPNATPGTKNFFAVTAYDEDGLESGFSDEVFYTQPNPGVPDPLLTYNEGANRVPYDNNPGLTRDDYQWSFQNTGQPSRLFDAQGNPIAEFAEPGGFVSSRIVEAWKIQSQANDITVALIDFDFDIYHEDLQGRFLPGVRIEDGIETPLILPASNNPHGTQSAGIVGAVGGNGIGISGICRDGVKLLPIAPTLHSDFALAIRYAVDSGAKIINFPIASAQGPLASWHDAIEYARTAGVLVVCAAANPPWPTADWPADWSTELDNIVLVGGHNRIAQPYASGGYQTSLIHLLAPARIIVTTWPGNEYRYTGGTSFAAAHVSGVLALNYQKHPDEDYQKAKRRLMATVDKRPGYAGQCISEGALDAAAALDWIEILWHLPEGMVRVESTDSLNDPRVWTLEALIQGPKEFSITVDKAKAQRYFRYTVEP